jgi:hypothetical protein
MPGGNPNAEKIASYALLGGSKDTSASEWKLAMHSSLSGLRCSCWFLQVAAELITHGGEELVCKIRFSP